MADENTIDELTVVVDDATATDDTPASTPEAVKPAESTSTEPKTAAEAIDAAITDASSPRRITPKQEDKEQQDTRPRNADGTFKTETAEEKTERERLEAIAKETPEEKKTREDAEAAAAKKVDHVNDPIDASVKGRTAERMKFLIDTVKEQANLVEQHNALFDAVRGTGATPDEFAAMIQYMKAVRSTDAATLEKAYTLIQSELRGIAIKLGKPLPEVNLLRDPDNKDLVDEIRDGKITNQRAHEIALHRETLKRQQTITKSTADTERATAEQTRVLTEGRAALTKLGDELQAKDGPAIYGAKYDILVPMLKPLFERLDPREWVGVFTHHYNTLTLQAKPPAPTVTTTEKPRPLRPAAPANGGGAAAAPKSALEAINFALEQ